MSNQNPWQNPVPISRQEERNLPMADLGTRFGGLCLDALVGILSIITLGLAALIWNLVLWGQGQTPGKQMLKLRVYSIDTGKPATWGRMAIRQFLIPLTYSMAIVPFAIFGYQDASYGNPATIGFGYIVYLAIYLTDTLMIFGGSSRQRLADKWARTMVLSEK